MDYMKSSTTTTFNTTTANTRSATTTKPLGVIANSPMRLAVFPDTMNIGAIRQHYSIIWRSV